MPTNLARLGKLALDFLLPQSCLGCGREGEVLCAGCLERLPRIAAPICARCGLPLAQGEPCPDCSRLEPHFDGLRAPFRFERLVREAIHQLKYQNLRCLASPLAAELGRYLHDHSLPADVIIPVPLHPRRLRQRGYNQSELVAVALGRMLGLKVDKTSLKRMVHTEPQARVESAALRRQNMAGAFACAPGEVGGRRILLVDDVATSGATINGCALALKKASAASVWGLTIAREV